MNKSINNTKLDYTLDKDFKYKKPERDGKNYTIREMFHSYGFDNITKFIQEYMEVDTIPVSIDKILDQLDISLHYFPQQQKETANIVSIIVISNTGKKALFLNESISEKRLRYIAVCSILYCFINVDDLDSNTKVFFDADFSKKNINHQILDFTTQILIPIQWLKKARYQLEEPSIDILASMFNVENSLIKYSIEKGRDVSNS